MHTYKLKHWSHEIHVPGVHDYGVWMRQVVRSERFWAITALVVLVGILITLAIIAGQGGLGGPRTTMPEEFYPFVP